MAEQYHWDGSKDEPIYRRRRADHFGWWVMVAVIFAVLFHAAILVALGKIPFLVELGEVAELETTAVNVQQVEVQPENELVAPDKEEVPKPPEDAASLLTEVEELLPELQNIDIDVSPEIEEPDVAIKMEKPALEGDEAGDLLEPVKAPEVSAKLDELGSSEPTFAEVPEGRVVIEEGSVSADIPDPDEFLKDAAKKGSGGLSDEGLPEGYTGLGTLLKLGTGDLEKSRAALPSDLLYAYDSAELKETARLGLMKLAILIDRNPEMYCILEGHSDLFGTEEYNLDLSRRRAQAVKTWLVNSLRLDGDRIIVRGYGNSRPKVMDGSIEEQAINRRVDILMRKELPADEPVLVRPNRAIPVPEVEVPSGPVRAVPVEEGPVRAIPVEE
jgi:outer membrane protein OmpA-like peptidoglycan-associated protein